MGEKRDHFKELGFTKDEKLKYQQMFESYRDKKIDPDLSDEEYFSKIKQSLKTLAGVFSDLLKNEKEKGNLKKRK